MQTGDREEFVGQMRRLCAGMDVPATDDRIEAYWVGLSTMSLIQFARVVEHLLGPNGGHERIPKAPQLWGILKALRTPAHHGTLPSRMDAEQGKWLKFVNGLFLRYLVTRRIDEKFAGDLNLEERRAECLQLATWFESLEAEGDPEATFEGLRARFTPTMARIQDIEQVAA